MASILQIRTPLKVCYSIIKFIRIEMIDIRFMLWIFQELESNKAMGKINPMDILILIERVYPIPLCSSTSFKISGFLNSSDSS